MPLALEQRDVEQRTRRRATAGPWRRTRAARPRPRRLRVSLLEALLLLASRGARVALPDRAIVPSIRVDAAASIAGSSIAPSPSRRACCVRQPSSDERRAGGRGRGELRHDRRVAVRRRAPSSEAARPRHARRRRRPAGRPQRLDDRVGDSCGRWPAEAAAAANRARCRRRASVAVSPRDRSRSAGGSSGRDPPVARSSPHPPAAPGMPIIARGRPPARRPSPRPRAPTPSRRAVVPAAWALYDFANTIFSFAVVSYAIGLWLVDDARFGERDRPGVVQHRDRRQRRAQRDRLADPRRAQRSRRPADCRSCSSSPPCASSRRRSSARAPPLVGAAPVHRRELRLPGRAHLLRRDAQARVSTRRRAAGCRHRGRHRVLRDGLRRAADLPVRHPGRRPVPARRGAVRAVRDPDLPGRPRAAADRPGRSASASTDLAGRGSSCGSTIAHAREVPGLAGSSSAGSSTRTRSTRSSS